MGNILLEYVFLSFSKIMLSIGEKKKKKDEKEDLYENKGEKV